MALFALVLRYGMWRAQALKEVNAPLTLTPVITGGWVGGGAGWDWLLGWVVGGWVGGLVGGRDCPAGGSARPSPSPPPLHTRACRPPTSRLHPPTPTHPR